MPEQQTSKLSSELTSSSSRATLITKERNIMVYQGQDDFFSGTPVSKRIMNLIEKHADELTAGWLAEIRKDIATPIYSRFENEKELYQRAHRVFGQLGRWINLEATKEDLERYWTDLGRERRREQIPLSEVVHSLGLIRKHFWTKVESEGLFDTSSDMYQAMDLQNRVTLFFDRAIYYAVLGYEKE